MRTSGFIASGGDGSTALRIRADVEAELGPPPEGLWQRFLWRRRCAREIRRRLIELLY